MDVPDELKDRFKFPRQKSKLAGEIRGSFFVIKGKWQTQRGQCRYRIYTTGIRDREGGNAGLRRRES